MIGQRARVQCFVLLMVLCLLHLSLLPKQTIDGTRRLQQLRERTTKVHQIEESHSERRQSETLHAGRESETQTPTVSRNEKDFDDQAEYADYLHTESEMERQKSKFVLRALSLDASALSVTSFYYNDHRRVALPTPRVRALLGGRAVFWTLSETALALQKDRTLPWHAFQNRTLFRRVQQNVRVPERALRNASLPCAAELLVFVRVGVAAPFHGKSKARVPPAGLAELIFLPRKDRTEREKERRKNEFVRRNERESDKETDSASAGEGERDSKRARERETESETERERDGERWRCYYRGLYDNERQSEHFVHKRVKEFNAHYWPALVFCPAPSASRAVCDALEKRLSLARSAALSVSLFLDAETTFSQRFEVERNPHLRERQIEREREGEGEMHSNRESDRDRESDVAVCAVTPYESSRPENVLPLRALFFEWLRHYALLGARAIVYDAHPARRETLFSTRYAARQLSLSLRTHSKNDNDLASYMTRALVYHNYTLLTALQPGLRAVPHDNGDGVSLALYVFDDDRVLSFTHCRFDAHARYGLRRVIVADTDEFLFCPHSPLTPRAQREYLRNYVQMSEWQGYHQLSFPQRIVANKTDERVVDCLSRIATENDSSLLSSSLFDCFSPADVSYSQGHVKSVALAENPCLLTHFHHSCATSARHVRSVDCLCASTTSEQCAFLHVGLRDTQYSKRSKFAGVHSSRALDTNELKILTLSNWVSTI